MLHLRTLVGVTSLVPGGCMTARVSWGGMTARASWWEEGEATLLGREGGYPAGRRGGGYPVYLPGTMVAILPWHTGPLWLPGWTSARSWTYRLVCTAALLRRWDGDDALGSKREIPMGGSLCAPLGPKGVIVHGPLCAELFLSSWCERMRDRVGQGTPTVYSPC